jgi:hypothetical protein
MIVIGLTGLAGSGKSTVAKYLVESHDFTLLSFAGPLKKMLRTLDPIIGNTVTKSETQSVVHPTHLSELTETENELKSGPFGREYRRLLQTLGTDCIRAVEPDFWVNAAVAQMTDPKGRYVFDDTRFPNEAKAITEINLDGLWNIQRPGQEIVGGEHISEKYAGYMDESVYLVNDDLSYLYQQIEDHLDSMQFKNDEVSNSEHLFVNAISAIKNFQKNPGGKRGEE